MRGSALLCCIALATPMSAMAADPGLRDVIHSAWDHPLVTDAQVVRHITNTRAVLEADGGSALIRYPGITGVRVGDEQLSCERAGRDLVSVELAPGRHEVEVLTDGEPRDAATAPPEATGRVVDSQETFAEAAEALAPGDELVIADGIYRDWSVTIDAEGTGEQPIVVRPQTPGGAIFRGTVSFQLTGSHIVLRGLRFEHAGPSSVVRLAEANDCRVTQCQFFYCGNPASTFGHIVAVEMQSDRNRVDHCFFKGSKSMGIGQRVSGDYEVPVGVDNRYDHNIFRDVFRYWINGQENIQLGQNQRDFGDRQPRAAIERNLFDHAWGDSEIISNKSSSNLIRHNTAAHCKRAAFVLRGGVGARFEGNVVTNCDGGVRVLGTEHEIVNNLLVDNHSFGVSLGTGRAEGRLQVAADDTLVAHNTIVGSPQGVYAMEPGEVRPNVPTRCRILNNIIVSSGGVLLATESLADETIARNLLWGDGTAQMGVAGDDAIIEEPRLEGELASLRPADDSPAVDAATPLQEVTHDRLGRERPHGEAPDIGADEIGAAAPDPPVVLPPVPPRPVVEPGLYRGPLLERPELDEPLEDARVTIGEDLPRELLVQWRWRPDAWDSAGELTLEGPEGSGWTLAWGGATDEGKPRSAIVLRDGAGEVLATSTDVVYFAGDFRGGYGNNRGPEEPLEDRWYEFTLLLREGSLYVLLTGSTAREPVPVMVWNALGEDVDGPIDVSLAQEGSGWWRDVGVYALEYTGDQAPPAPPNLQARAHGGERIELTWGGEAFSAGDYTFEIHRSTDADFTPSAETVISRAAHGGGWDDFDVEPRTAYYYAVRAYNALQRSSEFATVEARSGTGGPRYIVMQASEIDRLEPPMVLADTGSKWTRTPAGARAFLWAPGAGRSTEAVPDEGLARFSFTVPETGRYMIAALVIAPDHGTDSFHVALDEGAFRAWHTGIYQQWGWSVIEQEVELDAGEHSISLRHRDPGTRLAAVLITSDLSWEPDSP
ncbi:MAG: polysaccharide lyase 6 family protein [Armatimonadota bacterium]